MTQPSLFSRNLRRLALLAVLALILGLVTGARAQGMISPVHGYVSVEPFELRKEFVMRFDTIAERIEATGITTIDASNRADLESRIGEWLEGKCPVEVEGTVISMERDRVHFVRPDPEKGLVVEDRESVPVAEALVGVVFAAALDGPPERVRVTWEVFPADGSEAIVEAGARGQRAARKLTPENTELIWENEAGLAVPELLALPPVPERAGNGALSRIVAIVFGIIGVVLLLGSLRLNGTAKTGAILAGLMGFAAGAGIFSQGKPQPPTVTAEQADEISYALLRNIYHAFDYRRESDIYDVLAKSAEGELLTQIYLEVQRSLQVESQGGARVRVTNLDLRKCELAETPPEEGFVANCQWVAVGTVTHWGHTHDRVNRYQARMTIGPREGEWRLLDLELESEERL